MTCTLHCQKMAKNRVEPTTKTVQRDGGRAECNGVPERESEQGTQRNKQVSHRPGPAGLHQLQYIMACFVDESLLLKSALNSFQGGGRQKQFDPRREEHPLQCGQ